MVHVEAGPLRGPPAFGQCQRGAGEPRWRGKLWVSPVLDHQPAFCLVCLGAESSSHASVALWVCRLRRAEIGDMPAQTLGLFSPACTPWRGHGFQGQVSPCPSLFVLHGQTAPGPHALPHRVLPHAGVLLAEGFVLSVVWGLLVEFHFFGVG